MKIEMYKMPDIKPLILLPPPVYYNGKEVKFHVSIMEEPDSFGSPIKTTAKKVLKRRNEWIKEIKNPPGLLMFSIFNQETPDLYNFNMSVRQDLEVKTYELYCSTSEETNNFYLPI